MRSRPAPAAGVLLLFAAVASAASAAAAAPVIERIVAVVDGRALCLSDVRAIETLDGLGREAALVRLVDETLIFQETFRLPQAALTPEEEREANVPDPALHRARRRRAVIRKYVAFRFRPQVRTFEAAGDAADRERRTSGEVERRVAEWVRDLRGSATIRYNPAEPD